MRIPIEARLCVTAPLSPVRGGGGGDGGGGECLQGVAADAGDVQAGVAVASCRRSLPLRGEGQWCVWCRCSSYPSRSDKPRSTCILLLPFSLSLVPLSFVSLGFPWSSLCFPHTHTRTHRACRCVCTRLARQWCCAVHWPNTRPVLGKLISVRCLRRLAFLGARAPTHPHHLPWRNLREMRFTPTPRP